MCSQSASGQQDVRPENNMPVGDREIILVKERRALRHARFETVGLDRDPSALALAPLELRRQHDVQKRVADSRTDAAPRRRLDMFEQETGVLIHPQVDRNVEGSAAGFAEALYVLERLPGPQGAVFGEEVVRANLVRDAETPRQLGVPRPANQSDVIRRKSFAQPFQGGQSDQEIAVMVELQDEQAPPAPPLEGELIDRDGSPRTCDEFGRIITRP